MTKKLSLWAIVFFALLIFSSLPFILAQSNKETWSLSGDWKFDGFKLFNNNIDGIFKVLFSALLDLNIRDVDGNIVLSVTDSNGNERNSNISIKFDSSSGKMGFSLSFPMPNGKWKNLTYNFSLNGDYNTSKFVNPSDYYNKTLRDILNDLLTRNINITMVGEKSNITMSGGDNFSKTNPVYNIVYERNIIYEESKDSFVITEAPNQNITSNTTVYNPIGLPMNYSNVNNKSNGTKKNQDVNFNLSYTPDTSIINIKVNETKNFEIEDSNFDSTNWYLDGKLVLSNFNSYKIEYLPSGEYVLKVEVRKGIKMKSHTWNINVEKKEVPKSSNFLKYFIMLIILLLALGIGAYFYIKYKGSSSTRPISAIESQVKSNNLNNSIQ